LVDPQSERRCLVPIRAKFEREVDDGWTPSEAHHLNIQF
jgi:hypothetical protein